MKKGILFLILGIFVLAIILMSRTVSAANCGGAIKCNCGDTLNESQTMWYDLNCTGNYVGYGAGLNIGANNIILDCAGHKIMNIEGIQSKGIQIGSPYGGATIKNCIINIAGQEFWGIYIGQSSHNRVINSTINSSWVGVRTEYALDNQVINSTVIGGQNGISFGDSNNKIINSTIIGGTLGIFLGGYVTNTQIIDSTIISLSSTTEGKGIYLHVTQNNQIINSNVRGNNIGIYIDDYRSINNTIINSSIIGNNTGIYLDGPRNNTIINSAVWGLSNGIYLESSSNNQIYNNLINGTTPVSFRGTVYYNAWNSSTRGNYYISPDGTGFSQTCTDSNSDGICDQQYSLGTNNTDYLPLAIFPISAVATDSIIAATGYNNTVLKLDSDGNIIWVRNVGVQVQQVAENPTDHTIYAIGWNPLIGVGAFTKLDNSGNILVVINRTTSGDNGNTIAIDPSDGSFYVGDYVYANNFAKYSANGTLIKNIMTTGGEFIPAVYNADSSVYVNTYNKGVYKFDKDGNQLWQRQPIDWHNSYGFATIVVDQRDGSVVATAQDMEGGYVGYVVRFDANGNTIWIKSINDLTYSTHAIDPVENVVYGAGGLYSTNLYKINLTNGNVIWSQSIASGIVTPSVDSNGDIYVGGMYSNAIYKVDKNGNIIFGPKNIGYTITNIETIPGVTGERSPIPLSKGWNLISITLILKNNSIENVFGIIMNKVIVINSFESGVGGGAKTYDPQLPEFSDLYNIDYSHGYWVKMNNSANLTILGSIPENKTIKLEKNWNLISYMCDEVKNVSDIFGGIMSKVIVINGFENGALTYDPKLPEFSDLQELKPNYGYWVKMNESAGLDYDSVC